MRTYIGKVLFSGSGPCMHGWWRYSIEVFLQIGHPQPTLGAIKVKEFWESYISLVVVRTAQKISFELYQFDISFNFLLSPWLYIEKVNLVPM